jgi:UDP-N-acetylglucosamine--N-acetylmuramyl-(pentapeptide) pyrophosphoryl-undecaprenol N-acetylglucosamine transferase
MWVGGDGGMEAELVDRAGIVFKSIPAAGLHGVGARALPGNLLRISRGWLAARRILREFQPDALFFTGGYVAGPMAFAGRRVPTLLYVPDIEPGLALKSLARYANRIALTAAESKKYFPSDKRTVVTGYPVRADLAAWSRSDAVQLFGLSGDLPALLIFGGSQGARSINTVILKHLSSLLEIAQIIHISGQLDWSMVEAAAQALPRELSARYHAMPYLHDMGAALAAADVVISRAGASVLGEFPAFGLPAVLVPYPHAWRYQKVNADYLAERGAAVILQDEILRDRLLPLVKDLLLNPAKREAMRAAMRTLAHPEAAAAIAGQLIELAGGTTE